MKIAAHKFYTALFVIVLLLQLYLPSFKANILFQLTVVGVLCFIDNHTFSIRFLKMLVPFVALFFIGFLATLLNRYHLYNILKDIFHFLKPITGLLLGYMIFRRINNFHLFIKGIVIAGIASSLIHLYIVFVVIGFTTSLEVLRELTKDNFLDLFALFLLLYYKRFSGHRIFQSKIIWQACFALLLVSSILYFSRTMVILVLLLVLTAHGLTRITATAIKYITIVLVLFAGLFIYLQNTPIKRASKGFERFLYKVKEAPAEIMKTHVNRENHRDLWDHWRAYEANRAYVLMEEKPYSFLFGTGHGSLVDLKFYAPLTGRGNKGMRYISELHNGYMYMFYKTGIIGLLIYLTVLFRWYKYIYRDNNFNTIIISGIAFFYILSTLTISGMYNGRDIIIFILGGALFYNETRSLKKTENGTA